MKNNAQITCNKKSIYLDLKSMRYIVFLIVCIFLQGRIKNTFYSTCTYD